MNHPDTVLHLEHDGKLYLVDDSGNGPQLPVKNRTNSDTLFRLPTVDEIDFSWQEKNRFSVLGCEVIKAHPDVDWPSHWAWKDDVISDDAVHPIARESVYRSLHRLVSKLIIQDDEGRILMGKATRGVFAGQWSLPGGYMDHDEHPEHGAIREALEEFGIKVEISDDWCVISQNIFSEQGVSFVSFTYRLNVDYKSLDIELKPDEMSDFGWFHPEKAVNLSASWFDKTAIDRLL